MKTDAEGDSIDIDVACELCAPDRSLFSTKTSTSAKMTSDRHRFDRSGPVYLSHVDWNNAHHRRVVAASLVQGVYILERDQQEYRRGCDALATPWWDFFNFKLKETIMDKDDESIIGAIYQYKLFDPKNTSEKRAPQFVIAFRGTILNVLTDIIVNIELIKNGLKKTDRFMKAMNVVEHYVSTKAKDGSNLWLTGHSLGSSMAMKAARNMAEKGIFIETLLFNPPFLSLLSIIKNETLNHMVSFTDSLVRLGAAFILSRGDNSSVNTFRTLREWSPNLYVHPGDYICSRYIRYFQHRIYMKNMSSAAGHIENFATQHSMTKQFKNWIGKEHDVLHLIPSAILNVNESPAATFHDAHTLHQWWRPDIYLHSTVYKFGE